MKDQSERAGGDGLLPCPFCGGQAIGPHPSTKTPALWRVSCRNCAAAPSSSFGENAATKKWNTRAAPLSGNAGERDETRKITDADREYASELLADLASPDLPRLEIAARWFRKARVENALTALPQPAPDAVREALRDFEDACERIAATRPQAAYIAMIDAGQGDFLTELDAIRSRARALLTSAPVPSDDTASSKYDNEPGDYGPSVLGFRRGEDDR